MNFIADLHIHSRYSMATSKGIDIAELSRWGAYKGISVLSTGDFTHPAWKDELQKSLRHDDNTGLFRPDPALPGLHGIIPSSFVLGTEISCVYKKDGKTRKVHNLVFAPDFDTAEKITLALAKIGRLDADGRPILKLDSRNLLEIVLEASPRCVLIPAHIWTPWYSLFGSRSGFDSLEECFGDLSGHIFALETGLSSDPAMNRLCGQLDKYALISNSDAHSGANLGREANIFKGEPGWEEIFGALRRSANREKPSGQSCEFLGTLEFFPEEGKYHLDGHRNCGVVLTPAESASYGNLCPVCGKPLTIGVLNRVMELADRDSPPKLENEPDYACIVPLGLITAEILGVGTQARQLRRILTEAINTLGPELDILCTVPLKDIAAWWEPLGEAITRMRQGKIRISPGYDGEYGKIALFDEEEIKKIRAEKQPPVGLKNQS